MKKFTVLLGIIFIIGFILRFYRLGDVPVGFHRDEAFLGYNAYSILKTGMDMNGNFLPLHLESFLYSPAGYSYFSIPFIALFDLSVFSVRFASALFGSITIIVFYFLTKEFLINKKYSLQMALVAAGILSVSPWHINLSRTATENVLVVFFLMLGTFLYLLWAKKGGWWFFVISFVSFALTMFIYQAPRAFLPFFLPLLIYIFPPVQNKSQSIKAWMVTFLVVIIFPLFFILASKDLNLRLRTVSIFATEESRLVLNDYILTDGVFDVPILQARFFHNKIVVYTQQFLENYFSHFSYQFLFSDNGFPERYKVPHAGLLYGIELPFLFFGFWRLFRNHKKVGWFLLGWILITPIGTGLTFDDVPNLQRTLMLVPVFSLFTACGVVYSYAFLRTRLKNSIIIVLGIFVYSIFFYLHQYYVHAQVYRPWYRQDGYKQLVAAVNNILPKYQNVIITDRESAPTIFFLFFGKYDPSLFQTETASSTMRDFDRINFGKYVFSQEECPLVEKIAGNPEKGTARQKNVLYVNSGLCRKVTDGKEISEIRRRDESIVFRIYSLLDKKRR